MERTGWLGLCTLLAVAAGWWLHGSWPERGGALDCPPEALRAVDAGQGTVMVVCAPGAAGRRLPPAWARALHQRLLLNRLTREELAAVPGVGARLAGALVRARTARGGFSSWDEVDDVPGVGPAKLELLREILDLGDR